MRSDTMQKSTLTIRLMNSVAAILMAALAVSCGGGNKRPPQGTPDPDKFLFDRGTEELDKRHWLVSRVYFRELIDTYPQSRYRADAKLGVGDTFLGEGSGESYVLALNEYREFLAYYPTHERVDYAQFKLGMTHFRQMHGPDRDQTETKEAIREFTIFVERYPNSKLIEEGRQRLRDARDRLSTYEYNVGYHYYRSRWLPGAVDRFTALLKNDPQFTRRDSVYFYLGECFMKAERPAEALPYFDRILKEFEQSEHLLEAQKRVDAIKAQMADPSAAQVKK